jgi:hypothetical protein
MTTSFVIEFQLFFIVVSDPEVSGHLCERYGGLSDAKAHVPLPGKEGVRPSPQAISEPHQHHLRHPPFPSDRGYPFHLSAIFMPPARDVTGPNQNFKFINTKGESDTET